MLCGLFNTTLRENYMRSESQVCVSVLFLFNYPCENTFQTSEVSVVSPLFFSFLFSNANTEY